jgi:hypothetical protein
MRAILHVTIYYKRNRLAIAYNENIAYVRCSVLNTGYNYRGITNIMSIIKIKRKGKHLNRLCVYGPQKQFSLERHARRNLQPNIPSPTSTPSDSITLTYIVPIKDSTEQNTESSYPAVNRKKRSYTHSKWTLSHA